MQELSIELKVNPALVLHALLAQAQQDLLALTALGATPSISRCHAYIDALHTCLHAQNADVQAYLASVRLAHEKQAPHYSIGQLPADPAKDSAG